LGLCAGAWAIAENIAQQAAYAKAIDKTNGPWQIAMSASLAVFKNHAAIEKAVISTQRINQYMDFNDVKNYLIDLLSLDKEDFKKSILPNQLYFRLAIGEIFKTYPALLSDQQIAEKIKAFTNIKNQTIIEEYAEYLSAARGQILLPHLVALELLESVQIN
jgi:hypothetical protein